MNTFLIKLCWKNIWRNRRRTLLTTGGIAFGVMWLVWAYNYYDAFHEQLIGNAIRYRTGHLTVATPEYHKRRMSSRYVKDPMAVEHWLRITKEVKTFSARIHLQGLLSSANSSANIRFIGVDPKREKQVTGFADSVVEGNFLDNAKGRPIVLGKKLAESLSAKVGSKLVALTQGVDGSIGNELFYVSGIFDTQSDLDGVVAFIVLEDARSLLSLPPRAVHEISILLYQDKSFPIVQEQFKGAFPDKRFKMLSWTEMEHHLMGVIELHRAFNRVLMFVVLFIACLGIANAILMGLMERTREFGVMMAMGISYAEMAKIVLTETFLLSAVGVFVGNVLGILGTLYFNRNGFDLQWLTDKTIVLDGSLMETVSYPTVQWSNSLSITLVILVLAICSSMIPLQHVSKLKVVESLTSR